MDVDQHFQKSFIAGGIISAIRREHGQWFKFLQSENDLGTGEIDSLNSYTLFFEELESTKMTRSFKMVLLEALLDLNGFSTPPRIVDLARRSFKVMNRRKEFHGDLLERFNVSFKDYSLIEKRWIAYWKDNPIKAWIGTNRAQFEVVNDRFVFKTETITNTDILVEQMVLELINYRYEQYIFEKESSWETACY